jgi:hypothetical protein
MPGLFVRNRATQTSPDLRRLIEKIAAIKFLEPNSLRLRRGGLCRSRLQPRHKHRTGAGLQPLKYLFATHNSATAPGFDDSNSRTENPATHSTDFATCEIEKTC